MKAKVVINYDGTYGVEVMRDKTWKRLAVAHKFQGSTFVEPYKFATLDEAEAKCRHIVGL